jgi:hypothetical protein
MNKLGEMCKIIFEDNMVIYMKPPTEVDAKLLKTLSLSFTTLTFLFQELTDQWFDSKSQGPDAIE